MITLHSRLWICVFTVMILLFIVWGCSKKSDDIPTYVESVDNLVTEGWTAFQEEDYISAAATFEEAVKRDVDPQISIDAYRGLGWTYARLENYAQAVTNFNFVISLENVRTDKRPIVSLENVIARSITGTADSTLNGPWELMTDQYIVGIEEIESYSARVQQKLGIAPAFILEGGTRSVNLPKPEISNAEGTALGDALDHSLTFSPDTLKTAVASPEELDTIDDYYLDAKVGVLEIQPRIYDLEKIEARFQYHEKAYVIDRTEYQLLVLDEELIDGEDTPLDSVGDIFYLKGDFYNKYRSDVEGSGGTYYQADAYAGMASVYLAQGDYESAIKSVRGLIYINEDLKELDAGHYPYTRTLFSGDEDYNLWDFYKLLAVCYYNIQDYLSSEKCLEVYLMQDDVVDNNSDNYVIDLIEEINALPDSSPDGWQLPSLW